ncbi:MAG: DUF4159 domain-containing protein [Candidatus Latescibacteria bacterium]|jgi:hypothetical protein|nr:hypothetical protein [Gemmatimonadaceae bacterium]MDP6017871.1 DUF4159 domain-containing protein [Candidatus Latescibacterota bacterium]MDP7447849.1 DUF4159 domain-containing protein [Candidatus Latescibacterota bacterium]HJP30579.1 DUF4159 domain-containing protein [Candidatus Latescibacterota bacterium]
MITRRACLQLVALVMALIPGRSPAQDTAPVVSESQIPEWRLALSADTLAKVGNVVVVDSTDRHNLLGQVRLAEVAGVSTASTSWAVGSLIEGLNELTPLEVRAARRVTYSSRDLLRSPWIFLAVERYQFTGSDLRSLGRYMTGGGFVLADGGVDIGGEADVFARTLIEKSLATAGKRAKFRRLRADHPIYHSYFDFDHPPLPPKPGGRRLDYLIGVRVDGRLLAVISYQGLQHVLGGNSQTDVTRHLQFGINTIIFALTQEGGLTKRVER